MIRPPEFGYNFPVRLANDIISSTSAVWKILAASKNGDLTSVTALGNTCPELLYAQYNYTPPIHFAVREGHIDLVKYLLTHGAHSPDYKTYPFQESLQTVALDRGYTDIAVLLDEYASDTSLQKFAGDNGAIDYQRTDMEQEFENAVDQENMAQVENMLNRFPGLLENDTYFWGEGILTFAAKENNRPLIDLLMNHGARFPSILKWAQFYYFERLDAAAYILEKGMNPNTTSWHEVTILHDMAQKGFLDKAELLIKHGADLNPIDDEFRSTPLGMAARWGHIDMVNLLIEHGADVGLAGAAWATPLVWARKKGNADIAEILIKAGAFS